MPVWNLRPRFDRNGDPASLAVEILQVDANGEESGQEDLRLERANQTDILQPEGLLEILVQRQIEKGRRQLILDLQRLEKADSSEVGEIVAAVQRTSLSGGELLLANLTPKIREIFRRTELDRMIPVFDSVAAARRQYDS